jgi:hypothetical protein
MQIKRITLEEFDERYSDKSVFPSYCCTMSQHIEDGDHRLAKLRFDDSAASYRLWNFLLTEEDRLKQSRKDGKFIIGTMKDLGTIPVMAYSIPDTIAFYPDGAWWIPCIMELSAGLLSEADNLGIDESFCPVRAMLGAFVTGNHFPIPDMLISSAGAVCDDFSAIVQRLDAMGHHVEFWEMPHYRKPEPGEESVFLNDGRQAPLIQHKYVVMEMERIRALLEDKTGKKVTDIMLSEGIKRTNVIRRLLNKLRTLVFTADFVPLPALELLIAEMLAIHFCSDIDETEKVISDLVSEVEKRIKQNVNSDGLMKVFWINPVADLRAMNLLEDCGCRLCGTDFMFTHALDEIPEDIPPIDALALIALSDPMTADSSVRAHRIVNDIKKFGSEAVIISKIPGASHCAFEGKIISDIIKRECNIPVIEIEVPPLADAFMLNIKTKIEALKEIGG